jgi:catalase
MIAGTFKFTGLDTQRETGGDVLVFDPCRITDGIELSDDPVLQYRSAAYSDSVRERTTAERNSEPGRAAEPRGAAQPGSAAQPGMAAEPGGATEPDRTSRPDRVPKPDRAPGDPDLVRTKTEE